MLPYSPFWDCGRSHPFQMLITTVTASKISRGQGSISYMISWRKHVSIFVGVSQKTNVLEVRAFSSRGSSHKTFVLEIRIFSFRGSLVEHAPFGSPDLQFARKPRRMCSFTKSSCKWFESTLKQRSWDKNLTEVVLQGFDRSAEDPDTPEILHKHAHRILIQWSKRSYTRPGRILIQRSWQVTTGSWPTGSGYKWPKGILMQWSCVGGPQEILNREMQVIKRQPLKNLAQVVLKKFDTAKLNSFLGLSGLGTC